jgi:hypothetical protein
LVQYVQGGGCLALAIDSGKYTVESGVQDHQLLQKLGLPVKLLETSPGQEANVTTDLWDGKLVFKTARSMKLPQGFTTLANAAAGKPVVVKWGVGKGEVILFLGEVDWEKSEGVLEALCQYRGVRQWADAGSEKIRVFCLSKNTVRYVACSYYLHLHQLRSANWIDHELLGKDTIKSKVRVLNLDSPKYAVSDMVSNQDLGVFTREMLAAGIDLEFQAGQMRLLKCEPVK